MSMGKKFPQNYTVEQPEKFYIEMYYSINPYNTPLYLAACKNMPLVFL